MVNRTRLLNCFTVLLVLVIGSLPVCADQGKDLFDKMCAGCHTIGGGDGGGPDLKGVVALRSHEWLESMIMDPGMLTARKDPIQAELVKKFGYEMPNLGVNHEDALEIIRYLTAADGGGTAATAPPASEQITTAVTPQLIAQGKALFAGSQRLSKGGAPCLSCHPFAYSGMTGGNLSVADLGKSYEKMGDSGMQGALKALKFPIMKKIYADRSLTDDETMALMALFKDSAVHKADGGSKIYPLAGVILFVGLLLGLFLYKRRIR